MRILLGDNQIKVTPKQVSSYSIEWSNMWTQKLW